MDKAPKDDEDLPTPGKTGMAAMPECSIAMFHWRNLRFGCIRAR